jgi:hypothetical protein
MGVEMDKSGIGQRRRGFGHGRGQQSLGLEGTQGRLQGRLAPGIVKPQLG